MKRKEFISQLGMAGVGISALGAYACKNTNQSKKQTAEKQGLFFQLSLAQWSINRMIRNEGLSPYEFAGLAKKWGFTGLEYVSQLYRDVIDSDTQAKAMDMFIEKNNQLTAEHGLTNLLIMIDGEGDMADTDASARTTAVDNHKKWVDAAAAMNCHSIRVNLFGAQNPDEWKEYAAESMASLATYASANKVNIIVENHGGFSSDASLLMEVINGVNMDNLGTLPDFGNFCVKRDSGQPWGGNCVEEYDRYKGVKEMMPKAFGVSAKSYDFDADGNETSIDFKQMLSIVKASGYKGFIGVEYEGNQLSEEAGIVATRDLLASPWK